MCIVTAVFTLLSIVWFWIHFGTLLKFMHFVSAGGLALSVGEIMLKSDTALYHFCTINSI